MIHLDPNARLTKWFVWCCDYLPLTVTRDYSERKHDGVRRSGDYYLSSGTTLCHVFWATLWMPMVCVGILAIMAFMFTMIHVASHRDFGDKLGIAAYLIPEMLAVGMAAAAGVLVLAIIGGNKAGLFKLIWIYLRGIKEKICPLVEFDNSSPKVD